MKLLTNLILRAFNDGSGWVGSRVNSLDPVLSLTLFHSWLIDQFHKSFPLHTIYSSPGAAFRTKGFGCIFDNFVLVGVIF